jgi:hypothetical protein
MEILDKYTKDIFCILHNNNKCIFLSELYDASSLLTNSCVYRTIAFCLSLSAIYLFLVLKLMQYVALLLAHNYLVTRL